MTKNYLLYLYGGSILIGGTFLLFSQNISFSAVRIILGGTLIFGAIFSFLIALSRQSKNVQFVYHELHFLPMMVYGVYVMFFCNELESLIYYTSYLFIFYTFSEIIFCNWLFNLRKKVKYKVIFVRLALALLVGVGVIFIMYYPHPNTEVNLEHFGMLFIIVGVNILLYVPVMKTKEILETIKYQ
jgi:uncharacterized membrane protein HdeD (DUF308 family)